jgi:iron(III) transport system substrate-binding protein
MYCERFAIAKEGLMTGMNRRAVLLSGAALAGTTMLAGVARRLDAAEGGLTLYNGQHRATSEALVAAFTAATSIQVTMRNAESPELAAQITEEGVNSPADLFYSEQSPPVASLQEKGLLAPIDKSTLALIPSKFSARDGTWIGASVRTRVITYNKKMVPVAELPKSIMDFGTAALKGKFGYVKQDGFQEQVMAIVHIKGRDAALAWLKGLKEYGRAYNGNRIASTAVENGEIALALSNNYYWYSLAKEKGAETLSSALYYLPNSDPGNIYNVSAAGILKSSKNQALAQKFLAFMVSPAGQEAMAKTTAEYPVIDTVKSPFPLPPLSNFQAPVTPADMGSASDAYALEREAGLI